MLAGSGSASYVPTRKSREIRVGQCPIHWLFDRGILSLEDDGQILMTETLVPNPLSQLITPDRQIILPPQLRNRPHPLFLRYHREQVYKGD